MVNEIKNKLRLKEEHVKYLSELPETGMGYQIVNIILVDGRLLKNRIVLNSEFIVLEEDESINPSDIQSITMIPK